MSRCHRKAVCVLALAAALAIPSPNKAEAAGEHAFYVSPGGSDSAAGTSSDRAFATLTRARDAIRQLKRVGPLDRPVTVYLADGMHRLAEPLVLSAEDSGTEECPITYTAAEGADPVLSGGRTLTGWKIEGDRWVLEIPEVRSGRWSFRQLYVDGELRPRAKTPNEGFLRVAGFPDGGREVHYHTDCRRFQFAPGDLDPNWTNLSHVEVIVYHFWTDSHLPIESIDTKSHVVTFRHKAGKVFTDDFTSDGARYVVENLFEGLDRRGEWYLDRKAGLLHYLPLEGEDPRRTEVVAPLAPALIRLVGDAVERRCVEHVRFSHLRLAHANFELPPGNSNDRQGSAGVAAAITLSGARRCGFENCTIENLGTWAFEVLAGSRENFFRHNRVRHVAAGGFRLDGGTERDHPLLRTAANSITDNVLEYYGDVYPSAVGVLLINTSGNEVAHNLIHHGWYTGVSIGWCWGYQRSTSRDNRIEHNHIHHIGQGLLSDMGAIYTLGVSPGTVIRNNLIHDVEANHYGGWGIYNDEGSSHILVENNVVYNTKFAGYNIHYAKEVTVRNNVFAFGRLEQLSRSRVEPHKSVFFENNIVYWTEGELLSKSWRDKPYAFHFHPKDKGGDRQTSSTFDMDWNVYFNPALAVGEVSFNGLTLSEWRKLGKDRHSVYADPRFVDAEDHDFRLQPDSPAPALGFQPIDTTTVGPRKAKDDPAQKASTFQPSS